MPVNLTHSPIYKNVILKPIRIFEMDNGFYEKDYISFMLSKKTKYALKALTFLARQEEKIPVKIATISESENIPLKFLESILLTLKKNGYLRSKKGQNGGYYLLKNPDEILMTEIMRILEGPIAMVSCVSLNYYEKCEDCPNEEECVVHNLMMEVRDSTLKIFRNTSLADLAL